MRPAGTEDRALFGLGCWRNGCQRPVLKHGPRSRPATRVFGRQTRARNESERGWEPPSPGAHHRPILMSSDGFEYERRRSDPKDGELYVDRVKPEETLVEARSGSDVQIDRQICV